MEEVPNDLLADPWQPENDDQENPSPKQKIMITLHFSKLMMRKRMHLFYEIEIATLISKQEASDVKIIKDNFISSNKERE